MTNRSRMMAALAGEASDLLPWAPRMDLWYIANRARGTLPEGFVGLDTVGIARKLGVACHALRADYSLPREPDSLILRGFGVDNHPDYPYSVSLKGLPFTFTSDAENVETVVTAPSGDIHTWVRQSASMTKDGISVPFVKAYPLPYPVESPAVFDALVSVYEHIEVKPEPVRYARFRARVGEEGLAIAHGLNFASPMHLLLHDLMPMEGFFLQYMEDRDSLHALAARIEPFFDRVLDAVLQSECEVFFWGGNYDQNTTFPGFFEEEIAPWLRKASAKAEARGKRLLTHTDGENRLLLPLYPGAGFHVAESFCPAPMTEVSLAQFRAGLGPRQAVWGGIPAIALLPGAMPGPEFEAYLDMTFDSIREDPRRLILGVSDNVPPDADLGRIRRISEKVLDFGTVRGTAVQTD